MLVCNVSQLRRRAAIAADVAETTTALDAPGTGNVVFATLVDDPASVREQVDAYLGQIMREAANAVASVSAGLAYSTRVDEAGFAAELVTGAVATPLTAAVVEAASAADLVLSSVVADPYWSNVKLMMGFEGANGSTGAPGMTDESSAAHGVATVFASAAISTAHFKFGASSLSLNGSSSISFADHADWHFGAGKFTVEMFIYPNSVSGNQFLCGQWGPVNSWIVWISAGSLKWNTSVSGGDNNGDITGGAPVTGSQQHVCVDFDGSKYRLYLNGTMVGSFSTPRTLNASSGSPLSIGSSGNNANFWFNGYIDDLRITKGIARYASDAGYTVPSTAPPRGGTYTLDGAPINTTMSGGNLIATHANTSVGGVNSTSFDGPAVGNLGIKYYFEVTLQTSVTNGNSFGFVTPAGNVVNNPSVSGGAADKTGVSLGSSSSIVYSPNGTNTGIDLGPAAVNDVWGVAANLDTYKFWFRKNGGLWNGSSTANPATGAGGVFAALVSPYAPYGAFAAGTSGDVMKFNFGQTAFVGTSPF
jgi:hypothetical protein